MFETDPTLKFRQALASALLLVLINIVFRGKFIKDVCVKMSLFYFKE